MLNTLVKQIVNLADDSDVDISASDNWRKFARFLIPVRVVHFHTNKPKKSLKTVTQQNALPTGEISSWWGHRDKERTDNVYEQSFMLHSIGIS